MKTIRSLTGVIAALSLVIATALPANAGQVINFDQSLIVVVDGKLKEIPWGLWSIRYRSTYDGDGIIAAKVRDVHTDKSCVTAVYEDGKRDYVQARSCRHWTNHLFFDQTGDSQAWVRVNRTRFPDDPAIWWEITGY